MSALPPDQFRIMRAVAAQTEPSVTALADRWQALHAQAAELAEFAELAPEPFDQGMPHLPERLATVSACRRELVRQGIEDIDAMMQPGLTALRTIAARGQDTTAPALALWREFRTARNAALGILTDQTAREATDAA